MKRVFWGLIGGVGTLCGCSSQPLDAGEGAPLGEQTADVVLGFESESAWQAAGQTLHATNSLGQGSAALEVDVTGSITLQSAPFAFERTPNSIELTVRRSQGAQRGAQVSASLSCASKSIAGAHLANVALQETNKAERVTFAVPRELRNTLAGGCSDLKIELGLTDAAATYELDAMSLRAATPTVTKESAKLCGLPSSEHLVRNAVETPEGHWDYQDWLARASTQAEIPLLAAVLAPFSDVALEPAMDDVNQRIIVPVNQEAFDSGAVQAALAAAQLDLPLQVQPACHSVQDLKQAGEVLAARNWGENAAQQTFGAVLDPGRGAWVAMLEPSSDPEARFSLPPEAIRSLVPDRKASLSAASLSAKLGDKVVIEWGAPQRSGRLNDSQRHFGGAGISEANKALNCTAGFVVRRAGLLGAVTAAHCFQNGVTVFSGPFKYGKTAGRPAVVDFDMMRIDPDGQLYTNVIHTGPSAPVTRNQIGKADPPVGSVVCVSGAVTGAKCGATVFSTNEKFCDGSGCSLNLVAARRAGVVLATSGDSGAPVYTRANATDAFINGMFVASKPLGIILFHKVSDIEARLGVRVATSP